MIAEIHEYSDQSESYLTILDKLAKVVGEELKHLPAVEAAEYVELLAHILNLPILEITTPYTMGSYDRLKDEFGGKAAGLAFLKPWEGLGYRVPEGFALSVQLGELLRDLTHQRYDWFPSALDHVIREQMQRIRERSGRTFGDPHNPLLSAVRSGAKYSMPGKMSTVLNLGINEETIPALAEQLGELGAWQCFANFNLSFIESITGIEMKYLLGLFEKNRGTSSKQDLSYYQNLVSFLQHWFEEKYQRAIPTDPFVQLRLAIAAVYRSYDRADCAEFRMEKLIPQAQTGVNILEMGYGNKREDTETISGSGQCHSHNLETGNFELQISFAPGQQGFAVVDDQGTTLNYIPLSFDQLTSKHPRLLRALLGVASQACIRYGGPVDMEFVVENGELITTQVRAAKAPPEVQFEILRQNFAAAMAENHASGNEVSWIKEHVDPAILIDVKQTRFVEAEEKAARAAIKAGAKPEIKGQGIGGNALCGFLIIVPFGNNHREETLATFTRAQELIKQGKKVVLLSDVLDPNDLKGFNDPEITKKVGLIAVKGSSGSHAATIARAQGITAVVGCATQHEMTETVVGTQRQVTIGGHTLSDGDSVSINGITGEVYLQAIGVEEVPLTPEQVAFLDQVEKIFGKSLFKQLAVNQGLETEIVTLQQQLPKILKRAKRFSSVKAQSQVLVENLFSGLKHSYETRDSSVMHYEVQKSTSSSQIKKIEARIRHVMAQGNDASVRCAFSYTGEGAKLGINPWVLFKPGQEKLIRAFFTSSEAYSHECERLGVTPSKYGAWEDWQKHVEAGIELNEVLIGSNPPGKLDPEQAGAHFIASLTLPRQVNPELELKIETQTPHLRSFETNDHPESQIVIKEGIETKTGKTRGQRVAFGRAHCLPAQIAQLAQEVSEIDPVKIVQNFLDGKSDGKKIEGEVELLQALICRELHYDNQGQLVRLKDAVSVEKIQETIFSLINKGIFPDTLIHKVIRPDSLHLVTQVLSTVYGDLWQKLAVGTAVLEEYCDGSPITLEFQGRRDLSEINWFGLYGVKGMEEMINHHSRKSA